MKYFLVALVFALPSALLAQEGKFCEALEKEILIYIDEQNICASDSECATYTRCPFGCYRPLRKSSADDVESMFNTYDQLCNQCLYECVAKANQSEYERPKLKCISNKCQWTDEIN